LLWNFDDLPFQSGFMRISHLGPRGCHFQYSAKYISALVGRLQNKAETNKINEQIFYSNKQKPKQLSGE